MGNCGQLTTAILNLFLNIVLWLNLISVFLDPKKLTKEIVEGTLDKALKLMDNETLLWKAVEQTGISF